MSFDNRYYPNRKDRRKPYRGAKSFCRACRNHGSCVYCLNNRMYQDKKARQEAEDKVKEYEEQ